MLSPNSKLLNLVFLNVVLLEINLKLKLEKTVKPFKIYSDYQRPKFLITNDNSTKKEEIKEVILDNKIEINSLDNEDDIKIKKVGVWKLTKKHHSLDKDGVAFQLKKVVQMLQA